MRLHGHHSQHTHTTSNVRKEVREFTIPLCWIAGHRSPRPLTEYAPSCFDRVDTLRAPNQIGKQKSQTIFFFFFFITTSCVCVCVCVLGHFSTSNYRFSGFEEISSVGWRPLFRSVLILDLIWFVLSSAEKVYRCDSGDGFVFPPAGESVARNSIHIWKQFLIFFFFFATPCCRKWNPVTWVPSPPHHPTESAGMTREQSQRPNLPPTTTSPGVRTRTRSVFTFWLYCVATSNSVTSNWNAYGRTTSLHLFPFYWVLVPVESLILSHPAPMSSPFLG